MTGENYAYDAILIPGGGVRENFELPLWTQRRLDRAIAIRSCRYFIALSAGTTHKPPPLDKNGFPIFESVAAANYLIKNGIAPDKILYETSSYDTIGNAYFAKAIHVDPIGLSRLLVITSEFHMARTKAIFEWIYSSRFSRSSYDLSFEAVSDCGVDEDNLEARRAREKKSLENFLKLSKEIGSMSQLHNWLFNDHKAYSPAEDRQPIENKALGTY